MKTKQLVGDERAFFGIVKEAAFSNPFSDLRRELDKKITGFVHSPGNETDEILLIINAIGEKIRRLETEGKANIKCFSGEDKEIMSYAFLFDIFHKHIDSFDASINEQLKSNEKLIKITFAGEVLNSITKRGFSKEESLLYFALFFQLRRAFYFINNSIVGESDSIRKLKCSLWQNIFTEDISCYARTLWNKMEDFSTVLTGETGTGKGSAANAIGMSGFIPFDENTNSFVESFTHSFISITLSQYSENLIESELFGHTKGAFTGATETHKGVFSRCSPHGSIFLDEIGDVSETIQVKLLKVMQERVFSPVGSSDKKRFSGRLIAATNKSLSEMCKSGRLRYDFYYRLCSDIIEVPSLRLRIAENQNELIQLVNHTVERILGGKDSKLTDKIYAVIIKDLGANYSWPGNVRELQQCVRRILLKGHYEGFIPESGQDDYSKLTADLRNGKLTAEKLLSEYCSILYKQHGSYEKVSLITYLDRRTVKKYIKNADFRED